MASYIDLHNLGSYASIDALWSAHPEGGQEGDYCSIGGVRYRWDKYDRMWVANPNFGPTPARKVDTHYGDVNIHNDLTVAGYIRAKGIKQPCVGLFASVEALEAAYPYPEVGMWAVVGDTMPGDMYRCDLVGGVPKWVYTETTGGVDEIDLTDYAHAADVEELEDIIHSMGVTNRYDTDYLQPSGDSGATYILNGGVGSTAPEESTPYDSPDWKCMRIQILRGQSATISTIGGVYGRAYALTDTNRKILVVADAPVAPATVVDTTDNPVTLYAAQDGYVYVNCYVHNNPDFYVVVSTNIDNAIGGINERLDDIEEQIGGDVVHYDADDLLPPGYSGTDGATYILNGGVGSIVDEEPFHYEAWYWKSMRIPVLQGQSATISTVGGNNARAYALTDSNRKILVVADASTNTTGNPVTLNVTQDGYLYVNCNLTGGPNFYVDIAKNTDDVLDALVERVDALEEQIGEGGTSHYKNSPLPLWKDTLKVLAIGNSYSEDLTAYLGELIGSSGADLPLSKICVYMLKQSSASLQTWVENYEDTEATKSITRMAGSITMSTTSGTVAELLAQDWDVVIMQQLSTNATDYSTFNPYLTKLIGYIREKCTNQQVAIAWQSVWSYMEGHESGSITYGDSEERWAEICAATRQMMHKDGIDIVIPTGTAIQNARAFQALEPTFNAGNNGEVTRDGTHLEFGVGRYIAACTFFQTLIAPMFNVSVVGNPAVHTVTTSEQNDQLNKKGAVSVDNTNKDLCQKFAFYATIDMWNITEVEI